MALNAGTRLGPFEIVTVLGAGGMGEVYRAKDTRLGLDVAIKILPASISADPIAKQRFEREAKTISGLNHPNICVLYDVGSQDCVDYLVMECLEGQTLAARLQKGRLPCNDVLKIAIEITDALAHAHRVGLVHRDLKPSNIMLTKAGAKLMDFGLAKPSVLNPVAGTSGPLFSGETLTTMRSPGSPITCAGAMVGTIPYMSPEQIEGKEADARSDIFAFGAVLYEMTTGRRAFEGKSQLSIAAAILQKEPTPVAAIQPTSPPPLNYIISTCLTKDPEERFQTVHDVKLQLNWLAQSAAVSSAPKTDARSRVWAVAIGSALIVALAFGLMVARLRDRPADSNHGITRLMVSLPPKQELSVDTTQDELNSKRPTNVQMARAVWSFPINRSTSTARQLICCRFT
jgi:eukaryotic-like serine/threonine-protein kinase